MRTDTNQALNIQTSGTGTLTMHSSGTGALNIEGGGPLTINSSGNSALELNSGTGGIDFNTSNTGSINFNTSNSGTINFNSDIVLQGNISMIQTGTSNPINLDDDVNVNGDLDVEGNLKVNEIHRKNINYSGLYLESVKVDGTEITGQLTGNVTGTVSSISNHTTDNLTQGSTNKYYSNSLVDTHLSGGTGVTYNNGSISIGQPVGTSDNVQFNNITVDGTLNSDDITGSNVTVSNDLVVSGNLRVNGTQTIVNSTTLDIGDNKIVVNADGGSTPNAGIIANVDGVEYEFVYTSSNNAWGTTGDLNIGGNVTGNLVGAMTMTGHIIPLTGNTYDIGSPDKQIRDIYVSNNTIYLGEVITLSVDETTSELKVKKRKTDVIPKAIRDTDPSITAEVILTETFGAGHGKQLSDLKLSHYRRFARNNLTINGKSGNNIEVPDILTNDTENWEEDISIADINNILTQIQENMNISGNLTVGSNVTIGGQLLIDTINENTTNNGVVIEGVTLKDNILNADTIKASNFNVGTRNVISASGQGNFTDLEIKNNNGTKLLIDGDSGNITASGTLTIDTINENTTNNGVVIEGVTINSGNITATTFIGDGSQLTGINISGGGANLNEFSDASFGNVDISGILNISGGIMQTNAANAYNYLSYVKIDPCNNNIFEYNSTATTFQTIAYSPTLNRYVLKTSNNILYSNDGISFYIAQQNGSDFTFTDGISGYVKWISGSINKFFITMKRDDPRSKTTQTVYYSSDGITWINSTVNGMLYKFCPNYISYSPDLNTIILTGSGNDIEGLWESTDGGVTFNMNVTNTNNNQKEFLPDWEGGGIIFPVTWDSNLNKFILVTQSGNYTGRIFYNTSNTLSNNWTKITPVYDYNNVQLTNINYTFYDIAYSSTLKRTVIVGNRLLYSDYFGDNTNIANLFFKETRNINDTETSGISYKSVIWDSTNEYFIACGDANNSIIYSSDGINWYHNNIETSYPNNYLTTNIVALAMGSNKLVLISENTIIQTDSRYYLSEYIYLNNNGKLSIDTNILSSKTAFVDESLIAQNIYSNNINSNNLLIGDNNIKVDTTNNRLGIGIGNPTDTLHVKSDTTDNCYLKLDAMQNYETGIIFSITDNSNVNYERFKMYYDSSNDLIIKQNSNLQVFKVDNTGNIELGLDKNSITNNLGKLTVGSDTTLENTTINGGINIGKNLTMVNEQIIGEIGSIYGELNVDGAGRSVSLSDDGTIVAIGATNNDGNGDNSGHVRVFQYSNLSWTQLGSDIDGEISNEYFGGSVSLSSDGTILAVGGKYKYGNLGDSGHVRVYKWNGSIWQQLGADIEGESSGDNSGWSVSLSSDGTILAIGAIYNDENGNNSGHVRVYQYSNFSWTQLGSDIDGEATFDHSGYSVSLSSDGTILAIGAIFNDGNGNNSGHVRVYKWNTSIWSQLGSDINGEASVNRFGFSVSLSSDGTILAIGAVDNNGNGNQSGHVRVFQYSNLSWTQLGSDIDGENSKDSFGHSVSLSNNGNRLLVGAANNDGSGSNAGHVRLFENINSSWTQIDNDIDGSAIDDRFGYSVSLSGNGKTIAVGAPFYDHTGTDFGIVKLYKYDYKSANINNVTIQNGIVTATRFIGDGSQLTGINQGQVNGAPGTVCKIHILPFTDAETVNTSSTSYHNVVGKSFTKTAGTNLFAEVSVNYTINGYGDDAFDAKLVFSANPSVDGGVYNIVYQGGIYGGGGGRSGDINGAAVYTDGTGTANSGSQGISLQARRIGSSDDTITFKAGFFKVTELWA
jgi:hypothetical protein